MAGWKSAMPGHHRPGGTGLIDPVGEWPHLSSVAQVSYEWQAGVGTTEQRYYICSRLLTAAAFLQSARAPWGIENQRHWVRAGAFAADHCRARTGHAAPVPAAHPLGGSLPGADGPCGRQFVGSAPEGFEPAEPGNQPPGGPPSQGEKGRRGRRFLAENPGRLKGHCPVRRGDLVAPPAA